MKITLEYLKEKQACSDGVVWFSSKFASNEADYQEVLDALAKENRSEWAQWLMQHAGRTDAVLEVKGDLIVEHSIFFSGFIKATGKIAAKFIFSGSGIKAGWGIKAGSGIKAGEDFGIFAGLRIRISQRTKYAVITAKEKPNGIICGKWKEK